jgi:guanosine-3',5'-bis(diphosphate) 3'-pyrophosphohydrolase
MLSEAIAFATTAHEPQRRKGVGLPYVTHPLEAMNLLIRHGVTDETILAAAVLHDVVEDCDVPATEIERRFGSKVAAIVGAVTKTPGLSRAETKRLALEQLRRGPPGARSVKMADRLSNLLDLEVMAWAAEKNRAYLDEAELIAALGESELPALAARLREVAAEKRSAFA